MKVGSKIKIKGLVVDFCQPGKEIFEVSAIEEEGSFLIATEYGDFPFSDGEDEGWFKLNTSMEGAYYEEV